MKKTAILGGGNIGRAITNGMLKSGRWEPGQIFLTRRNDGLLEDLRREGVRTGSDNREAVRQSEIIILAVQPRQMNMLMNDIREMIKPGKHLVISVISAVTIEEIASFLPVGIQIIRAMPNTAIALCESMTCLAGMTEDTDEMRTAEDFFKALGAILVISEPLMSAATILGACGIAYFLRCIRAASQGGIQVGFHASEAQLIASQTAKGAAALLTRSGNHPEREIDKVTTPRGCTIAGLNEMEHNGLSSALIKGIITSFNELSKLK